MANGAFAVALFVLGWTEMQSQYCGTELGCLGRTETTPRLAVSAGSVVERIAPAQAEALVRYDLGFRSGPFGHAVGLSVAENGEIWVGFGQTLDLDLAGDWYAQLHAMPGLYFPNGGFDLGGPIEFRSGIELGYETESGWRFAVSYDHRSNWIFYSSNPGMETVQLRVSMPLR